MIEHKSYFEKQIFMQGRTIQVIYVCKLFQVFIPSKHLIFLHFIPQFHILNWQRLKALIFKSFFNKNGTWRYNYLVKSWNTTYFVKEDIDSNTQFTETQIVQMLDFLIDNIFVECGGHIFQMAVVTHMGTNCAPLLNDLFLYL